MNRDGEGAEVPTPVYPSQKVKDRQPQPDSVTRKWNSKAKLRGFMQRSISKALELRFTRSVLRYIDHHGPGLADSVTYRALFSVFAGVLLGLSIATLWLNGNPEAMSSLIDALERVIPGITHAIDFGSITAPTSFTIVGVAASIGLIGAAISAITSLRRALRVLADHVHDDGFFLWVLARNLVVAIAFGGLLASAAVLSAVSSFGIVAVSAWLGISASGVTEFFGRALSIVVVFVIDTLAVALIFCMLSGVRAPARALWCGAVLGGVGLSVLQELSSFFVRGATSNPLLATFATLIALLIWLNLSAQVILIASCYIIVATAESRDRVRERYGANTLKQYRRHRAEDLLNVAKRELRAAQETENLEENVLRSKAKEKSMDRNTNVQSVEHLDLERYLGLWFEIGRLPLKFEDDDAVDVTAEYTLLEDGTVQVDNRCLDADRNAQQAIGQAKLDAEHEGRLQVTFLPEGLRWIPFTHADYWVLKIDDEYQHAIVGTPDHKYLWLLARTPHIDAAICQEFLAAARSQGYDLGAWITTPHSHANEHRRTQ